MISTDFPLLPTNGTLSKPTKVILIATTTSVSGLVVCVVMIVICLACHRRRRPNDNPSKIETSDIEMTYFNGGQLEPDDEVFSTTPWPSVHMKQVDSERHRGNNRVDIRTYFEVQAKSAEPNVEQPQDQSSYAERVHSFGSKRKLSMLMRLVSGLAQRQGSRSSLASFTSTHTNESVTCREKKTRSGLDDVHESIEDGESEEENYVFIPAEETDWSSMYF